MHVDPRRLSILLAVHRAGGVVAAASSAHMSASAVSQQIARLEAEVGVPVLERQPKGAVLTPAGGILVETAERIETEITEAQRALRQLSGAPSGTVVIGSFKTVLRGLLLPLVAELRARAPGIDVHLREIEPEGGAAEFRSGHLDVLLVEAGGPVGRARPRGTHDVTVMDEPWLVAMPTSVPAPATLDDLATSTWLTPDDDSAALAATERLLDRLSRPVRGPDRYADYDVALAMVRAGLGIALIPALALAGSAPPPGVRVATLPGMERRVIVARHRSTRAEPRAAVREVLGELVRFAAEQTRSIV